MWRMWSCSFNHLMATFPRGGTLYVTLLLAGLINLSGCGSLSHASGSLPSAAQATRTLAPVATPTMPAARLLAWTPERLPTVQLPALPSGIMRQGPTLGAAQSDGATAYVCAPAAGSSTAGVATWLTHDYGASWQATAGISVDVGSPIAVTNCQIAVDVAQVNTAVAQVGFVPAGGCFPYVQCVNFVLYLTTDAGQHWVRLHGPQDTLDTLGSLATHQDVTYALFRSPPRSASMQASAFVMSRDNLRTWKPVAGPLGDAVTNFWLNPFNGDMLVTTSTGWYHRETFVTSTGRDATWTKLAAPPFAFFDFAVQQPFTDQPWSICGGDSSSTFINGMQQNTHMDALACTSDSGAHWTTHQLDVPNDRGGRPNSGANYTLVGIADDGSALLTTPAGLERVASGRAGAQALGAAPNAGLLIYVAGGGAGVLWSAPQGGYTNPDSQGRIFTAMYA